MNADTLAWTIVGCVYGHTGNMLRLVNRTTMHDALVPVIEEAMHADANHVCKPPLGNPTREEAIRQRDMWQSAAKLWMSNYGFVVEKYESKCDEIDRLTGALGEMTFAREAAERARDLVASNNAILLENLAHADSERLADAALDIVAHDITVHAQLASISSDSIRMLIRAARGRTEPSASGMCHECSTHPKVDGYRCAECLVAEGSSVPVCPVIVRRDNAAIFQEGGALIASGPCGNVMPCAEHPVTADCACKGKLERTGREEGKRPGTWMHAAGGCGFDPDEPYQPFVVHISAEDLAAVIDHSDHECGAESEDEKLWCYLDAAIGNIELRLPDPGELEADIAEVRRLYDLLNRPSGDSSIGVTTRDITKAASVRDLCGPARRLPAERAARRVRGSRC